MPPTRQNQTRQYRGLHLRWTHGTRNQNPSLLAMRPQLSSCSSTSSSSVWAHRTIMALPPPLLNFLTLSSKPCYIYPIPRHYQQDHFLVVCRVLHSALDHMVPHCLLRCKIRFRFGLGKSVQGTALLYLCG
jgi:hypothetical protein